MFNKWAFLKYWQPLSNTFVLFQLLHQSLHQNDKLGRSPRPLPADRQANLEPSAAAFDGHGDRTGALGRREWLDGSSEACSSHGNVASLSDRDILGRREEEQRRVGLQSAERGEVRIGAATGIYGE